MQLPNTWGSIKESLWSSREVIKVVTKVFLKCEHYIGVTHGTSEDCHRRPTEDLVGVGQGSILSGCVCRDVSCLKFKELEKGLGVII